MSDALRYQPIQFPVNFSTYIFFFPYFLPVCTITISSFPSSVVPRVTSLLVVKNEVFGGVVGDMQIDDPVHEIETDETNRKHDSRVFVDVRR